MGRTEGRDLVTSLEHKDFPMAGGRWSLFEALWGGGKEIRGGRGRGSGEYKVGER
jgi:hypothetical protein